MVFPDVPSWLKVETSFPNSVTDMWYASSMTEVLSLVPSMRNNDFLSGGLVLMLLAAAGGAMRHAPRELWLLLKRKLIFSVEVLHSERGFDYLQTWLHHQASMRRGKAFRAIWTYSEQLLLVPMPGRYLLRHKGKWMVVHFESERLNNAVAPTHRAAPVVTHRELIHLSCLGTPVGGREAVLGILEEATELAAKLDNGFLRVYAPIGDVSWYLWQGLARTRSQESLVLPAGVFESLQADIGRFLESRHWYESMGIPWRRGYMFHGAPGNGKTSCIMALATAWDFGIALLRLSEASLTDSHIAALVRSLPEKSFLVIEDVDTVFNQRSQVSMSQVTFSGLLNALDGIESKAGRMLFVTTNHPERLDPALIRPGRVDRKVCISNPTSEQVERLFLRFYPERENVARDFLALLVPGEQSMAVLQEHFLLHRDDPEGAVRGWCRKGGLQNDP